MTLTVEEGHRAYAKMINTGELDEFAALLADDFAYASQTVLEEMNSKAVYIEHVTGKLRMVAAPEYRPFAEMGYWGSPDGAPCVILAQGDRDNLVCTANAEIENGKISRIDMCIVPPPDTAMRSGKYPGLP